MSSVDIQMPPKLIPLFANQGLRYVVSKGGRGSGKTRSFAKMTAIKGYIAAEMGVSGVILSAREHLNSLSESSMEEIKEAIRSEPFLDNYYEMGDSYIRTKNRRVSYVFSGLRHNLDSIKSKARILLCWVDEAESVSEIAWQKLLPTVREEGSQIYVTYNPEKKGSATDIRFNHPEIFDEETGELIGMCVEMNYTDNPWFPDVLEVERRRDFKTQSPENYNWIWNGAYRQNSEAQIFANKYVVQDFEPDPYYWDGPYQGLDFGFANDPTAFVRAWIYQSCLYIEVDCGAVNLELDDTYNLVKHYCPKVDDVTTRADNARPESISHLKRKGMRIVSCEKGKGSVEDGIEFIRSFEKVIIHSRANKVKHEFDSYSYKVDRLTGEVLPIIVDKDNHWIDALRYSLEPIMKGRGNILDIL